MREIEWLSKHYDYLDEGLKAAAGAALKRIDTQDAKQLLHRIISDIGEQEINKIPIHVEERKRAERVRRVSAVREVRAERVRERVRLPVPEVELLIDEKTGRMFYAPNWESRHVLHTVFGVPLEYIVMDPIRRIREAGYPPQLHKYLSAYILHAPPAIRERYSPEELEWLETLKAKLAAVELEEYPDVYEVLRKLEDYVRDMIRRRLDDILDRGILEIAEEEIDKIREEVAIFISPADVFSKAKEIVRREFKVRNPHPPKCAAQTILESYTDSLLRGGVEEAMRDAQFAIEYNCKEIPPVEEVKKAIKDYLK